MAGTSIDQHLGPGAHGRPHVLHVTADEAAGGGHDEASDNEDRDQDEQPVAEADGVTHRPDDREHEEARQHEEGADGEADRAHPRRDGEGERRQDTGSDDGERGVDAGVADEGDRDVGGQREEHGEGGSDERRHGEHAEDQADVAPGQACGDDGADREADEVEDLDRRDEVGPVHRVEVEGLLILERGQRGEAGDGGGQEGQRDEDASQHTDLPDRPPGLAERRWRLSTGRSTTSGAGRRRRSGAGSPRSEARICSLSSSCSWRPRGGSRRRRPMATTTTMGTAKKKKGARQEKTAARPAPSSTPTMAPILMPERWAE